VPTKALAFSSCGDRIRLTVISVIFMLILMYRVL
jgi:hypothetical protein